jgi:hypothetical protein
MQSKAQQRLMYAAANHPGGFGGVPQSVGKDFVAAGKAKKKLPERKNKKAGKLYGTSDSA